MTAAAENERGDLRVVKEPQRPSHEVGADPERPVVSLFRVGGAIPSEFQAFEDDVVTVQIVDVHGNVLAKRDGRASVEFRPVHPSEAPAYDKRIQSIRFDRPSA